MSWVSKKYTATPFGSIVRYQGKVYLFIESEYLFYMEGRDHNSFNRTTLKEIVGRSSNLQSVDWEVYDFGYTFTKLNDSMKSLIQYLNEEFTDEANS